jgi:hypothetical protein
MKRAFLFFLLAGLYIIPVYCQQLPSQEGSILFNGIVMDAESSKPLPNARIIINRIRQSVSDSEGKFAFYVNRKDTVVFSMLGYKSAGFLVSDTLTGREFIAGIYLKSDTLSIAEVIIVPRYRNLKSIIMNPGSEPNIPLENAKYNLALSAYQSRVGQNKLGDPAINYEMIRRQQKEEAFSRGQITPGNMVGLNPFLLVPAAYLLIHGLPEKPSPVQPQLSTQEIDQIHRKYLETIKEKE